MYSSHSSAYLPVVSLLHKAYPPNDEGSVESYWEMLCEYKDGYRHAARLWKEVEPLYNMLHEFVRIRIQKYYKIADNYTSIPVYLLGSNFGTDWSAIANIILPHPQLYKEIEEALKGQSVEQLFRLAEMSTRELRLGSLGKQFWKKSIFNHSNCELHLFSNCAEKYTEAVTCAKVDLSSYMDIHDAAINIALRNQDYSSLARRDLRFSAVDEALQGLGSMIALDNLPANGFVPKDAWTSFGDETERKNAALLLTAIRTLPKLPYYLLSDVTRLHHLDNQQDNFIQGWWSNRKKWQGVQGNSNTEADFLGDHFISLNKPYLSKFLGIFLQFQLLERFSYYEDHENIVNRIKNAKNFRTFIKNRPNRDWAELVDFHYGISEISSDSLLNYFNPLKTYLKEAPFDFIPSDISLTTESETLATDTTNTVSNLEAQNISQPATAPSGLVDANSKHAGISNSTIWVIVGVVFVAILGVVTFLIVRKVKKRKRRTNNRRFET
uniref:Angiotensin-converting enzyme n=1 Tax=Photinus pyralis TaxID=7054 RepID=A0A1Y1JVZ7_PHOPY